MPKVRLVLREALAVAETPSIPLERARDVWTYAKSCGMDTLPVEEFHVLCLDTRHKLTYDTMVSRGILNSSLVHPREVFRKAIAENALSVVMVHNHPSGDPTPSRDDEAITAQLVAAGKLLDIPVRDHIIVGRNKYVSFAEAGLL